MTTKRFDVNQRDPDVGLSAEERDRLFGAPKKSWVDEEFERMTSEERAEFDAGYDEWKKTLPFLENMSEEDADRELTRMETEVWATEVNQKSVSHDGYKLVKSRYFDLMQDIGTLEKYQSAGRLDSDLSLDVKQNLYDNLGNFCANFVADLNADKLRQSIRTSGLGEGEILHRNARLYSQALRDGDFNRVYSDLNSEMKRVLSVGEKSVSEEMLSGLYDTGVRSGVISTVSTVPGVTQLFSDILDDHLSDVNAQREDLQARMDMGIFSQEHNQQILDKYQINPDDGIPAYVEAEMYPEEDVSVYQRKEQTIVSDFYDKVYTYDAAGLVSDELRDKLGDDYRTYVKDGTQDVLSEKHRIMDSNKGAVLSGFNFSKSVQKTDSLSVEKPISKESVLNRRRMADLDLDRQEDRELQNKTSHRRLPSVSDILEDTQKDDDWSFSD